MPLLEAAVKNVQSACSDINVFKEIMKDSVTFNQIISRYFKVIEDITFQMKKILIEKAYLNLKNIHGLNVLKKL